MDRNNEKGQVALIVVLMLVVMGVIVLSVVSRSISDLRLAAIEESSTQALKAAEAGVEEALRNLSIGSQLSDTVNDATYTVTTDTEGDDGQVTSTAVSQAEVVEVTLEGSPSPPTSLDIYWGDASEVSESPVGAVEVIKYQQWSSTDYRAIHYAFDSDSGRAVTNGFDAATGSPGSFKGTTFAAMASVPIVPEDKVLRVRMFYNQGKIGLSPQPGGSLLPDQVYRFVSTGQTGDGVVRKVEAQRTLPVLPLVFDAALYSGGSLSQN